MRRPAIPAVLLLLASLAPWAHADGDAPPQTVDVDLERFVLPRAAAGPRLAIPPDLIAAAGEPFDAGIWDLDLSHAEQGTWLPFDGPYLEATSVSLDTIMTVLQATVAHDEALADALSIDEHPAARFGLRLRGSPEALRAAGAALPWVLEGLAPTLDAGAVLTEQVGEGPERLRAHGRVRLWPGRWTRVYLEEDEVPCVPAWDIDVAENSTVMDPWPLPAREGAELYMRFHPGETRSVVEVWAGRVEHLEIVRQDLAAIRNVPEANGAATLTFARSAVRRAFTQVVVPAGEKARAELTWGGEGRRARLALDLGAAPKPVPSWPREGHNALALVRTGALGDALEYETRTRRTDAWSERVQEVLYAIGQEREQAGEAFEYGVTSVDGGSVFFLEATVAALEQVRATLRTAETGLATHRVRVRALAIPEPAYRRALLEGLVDLGRPVGAETLQAFLDAGAVVGETLGAPALEGTALGFRVGRSEPGLADMAAELAQASGGLRPLATARFAGMFGEVVVRGTATGRAVTLRGARCWADPAAGRLELVMREPLPMRPDPQNAPSARATERVSLPLLGGGTTAFDRRLELPGDGADDVLAHAEVRGDEVIVLLVSVR